MARTTGHFIQLYCYTYDFTKKLPGLQSFFSIFPADFFSFSSPFSRLFANFPFFPISPPFDGLFSIFW